MQLNITTDYAIRIILALANRDGEVVSSKDISMTMKIPQKYVLKIIIKITAVIEILKVHSLRLRLLHRRP